MSVRLLVEAILLALVVLLGWLGGVGMLRMKEPMQSLHYLSLPALATVLLTAAVFTAIGDTTASWKMLFIAVTMLAINSVVAHATARALRARELGHWQPRDGDPIEFVRDTRNTQDTRNPSERP